MRTAETAAAEHRRVMAVPEAEAWRVGRGGHDGADRAEGDDAVGEADGGCGDVVHGVVSSASEIGCGGSGGILPAMSVLGLSMPALRLGFWGELARGAVGVQGAAASVVFCGCVLLVRAAG